MTTAFFSARFVVTAALLSVAASACSGPAMSCLLCSTVMCARGISEDDPQSVREWPTPVGIVREVSWTPFSFPDSSSDCRYVLIDESGASKPLALVSVEVHSCEARHAPAVDEGGHLIVPSAAAFVVWNRAWPHAREVPLHAMTFRRRLLVTLDPTLRIDGDTWTIAVSGVDAFVSVDAGRTWRSAHADAGL